MKFILVSDYEGKAVLVNPAFVEGVTIGSDGDAVIHLNSGNSIPTNISFAEINRRLGYDS